jgi:HK97 family phage prohead protease
MTLRKQFDALVKSIDAKQGLVTSLVAVYDNVDAQNDRILPGAFDATIKKWQAQMAKGKFLPVVYGHRDEPRLILGKVVALRATAEGLEVDEQYFLNKQEARDTLDAQTEGVLGGSSFAYDVIRAKRAEDGVQNLIELDLIEVGPTIYPANDQTRLVGVKAVDTSEWDGNRAMGECSSAADYRSICAGERSVGEPDERQHWALPHHYLGRGPNASGVRNALSRLPQTEGLTNRDAAESHLQSHMSDISPSKAEEPTTTQEHGEKAGAVLSAASRKRIAEHISHLEAGVEFLKEWLAELGGDKTEEPEAKVEVPLIPALEPFRKQLDELLI